MAVDTTQGGYLNFNTYTPKYIGRPVQAIGQMMDRLDTNNKSIVDTSSALDIALSGFDIAPDDEYIRINRKNQMQDEIQSIIDAGDYGIADAKIAKISRDFNTDKDLQQAIVNKKAYDEYRTRLQERKDKGEISDEVYRAGMINPYQAVTKENGAYVTPNYYDYANQVDMNPVLAKIVQSLQKDVTQSLSVPQFNPDNPYEVYGEVQTTEAKRNKNVLKMALENAYDTTPGAKAFIRDQAKALLEINGQDATPEAIDAKSDELMQDMVSSYVLTGGQPQYQTNVLKGNTADLRTAQYKQMLKNQAEYGGTSSWSFPGITSQIGSTLKQKLNVITPEEEAFGSSDATLMANDPYFNKDVKPVRYIETLNKVYKDNPEDKRLIDGYIKYAKPTIGGNPIDSIEDINESNYEEFKSKFDNYLTTEFPNRINSSIHAQIPPKAGKKMASLIFGGDSFTRSKDSKDFAFTDSLDNYMFYDLESGKSFENRKDIKDFIYDYEGVKNSNKLNIRAMATLNGANPIPEATQNMNFANGTVYNMNGHQFVLSRKVDDKSQDMVDNIITYSQFKPNVEVPVNQSLLSSALGNVSPSEKDNYKAYIVYKNETEEPELEVYYDNGQVVRGTGSDIETIKENFKTVYNLNLDNE